MLKLKLQYFGHLMWRVDSLEKTLILGGIGGRRRRGLQRVRWLDGITSSMHMSLGEVPDLVMDREAWRAVIHGVAKSQTRLSDWIELNWSIGCSGTVFLVCEYVTTTNPVLPVRLDIEYHGHILPCLVPSCLTGQKGWDDISFWRNSQHSKPTVCDCEHHAGNTKD